jgi:hypothetical protein
MTSFMNTNLSTFLDISRWVAAFLVVFAHVRHLVLVDLMNVENNTILINFGPVLVMKLLLSFL